LTASSDSLAPAQIADELRRWAIEKALPLWSSQGFDAGRGGFQERLNPDGSPDIAAQRRLLVQARQTYVYAHAAALGWFPDGKRFALDGAAFILEQYRSTDGGYVFSLAPDNSVADPRRDTYGHSFVLLALAWVAKVSGDAQIHARLNDLLTFFDERLTARDGSLIEGLPASQPRRQNPHMHAFEAMLALDETLGHAQARSRAARFATMLTDIFLDPQTQTIGEYFSDDWAPQNRPVEPGHHAEWAWLMRKYERLRGATPDTLPTALLQTALRWRDPRTGFLFDEADRNGAVLRSSRRIWPQTELSKAWMAEAEIGVVGADDNAAAILRALAERYLDHPCPGGWTDQFDQSGRALTMQMPATAFYHVFGAIAEANRLWSK
jgi:mannose-6-phosphate isomerase